MPVASREAMLVGLRANERIIVGAYTDGRGGVCPMLAAHRAGGRTNLLSFARSWDRFTRAGRNPRPATEREMRILTAQIEHSLQSERRLDLDAAIAEHCKLVSRRQRARLALERAADPRGEIVVRRLGRALLRRGAKARQLEHAV